MDHLVLLGFGGRLPDIGSAFGHFGHLDLARGYSVLGVEPSVIARRQAQERFGVASVPAVEEIPPALLPFDVVVCAETPYYPTEVRAMLARVRATLRPHACFVAKTRAHRTALFRAASLSARFRGSRGALLNVRHKETMMQDAHLM